MRQSNEFRELLKQFKRSFHAGEIFHALSILARAKASISEDTTSPQRHKHGIVDHRQAMAEADSGDIDDARALLRNASRKIEADAPIERAMMLRDWGKIELMAGDEPLARRLINEALTLLYAVEITTPRLDEEIVATQGFLAQTMIRLDKSGALSSLRATATALKDKRPVYELEPVACLVENLPAGVERQRYILRAVYLCSRLGDRPRTLEYTALLGGKPLRSIYRHLI